MIVFTLMKSYMATTSCDVVGSTCTYRVICYFHPGSATNPTCSEEPNVTFVMKSSTADIVTTGFFGATNFDTRVRAFEAVNNTWETISALAFRYYHKVKRIDLSGNFIRVIQDDTFRTLVPLNHLNLSNNLITELKPKSLLISDSKSTDLETLDLSYNRLTSLSEEVLTHLPNLITLYLQGNKLKTLSDNCFGNQRFLTSLYLQHNYIDRLNMTLISLKRLKYLDLSFNYIKSISGYETNRLIALERINISNNVLLNIESNCFEQSVNLHIVDLSNNMINSDIKIEMFSANTKLEYLDISNNHIRVIEGNSFRNNSLTYINLNSNKLSGEIEDNTFAGLENITSIDLSQQNFTKLRNYAFTDLNSLINLNLSRNHINEIESMAFFNSSATIVDICYNNISKLDFLKNSLYGLQKLNLSNNNLTILHKNTFEKQSLLVNLELSGNNIITIEENSLPLDNLQYLNLINNQITGILKPDTFSPAKFLRALDLSNFNISKISNSTFVDMPVLVRLNLSNNFIEKIESDNFRDMDNMFSLDISYNNLTDLQFNNSLLTHLKAAYMSNNKLRNISKIFPSSCDLLYLVMSYNGISDLTNVDSKLFPELQTLHLSNNNIQNFNNPGTNSLSKLRDLGLSSNKITNIDLSYFSKLIMVDVSDNNISNINMSFFKNIEYLHYMDLSRNNITDIPPGTFQNMICLLSLNLSSNTILKLRYGSLKGLHNTEILDISNNKIESLDVHVFHECTGLKTLIIDYNRIKVLDIKSLVLVTQRNLKTLSLGGNPISCQEIIRNATLNDSSVILHEIEVTSVHKIYHEDNIYGIKCGEDEITTILSVNTELPDKTDVKDSKGTSLVAILVWCAVLTVLLAAIGVGVFIKLRHKGGGQVYFRESRVHLRNSLEIDGSECNNYG